MEAIGSEVIAVVSVPFLGFVFLLAYYWDNIIAFAKRQLSSDVRMEQSAQERQHRQRWNNQQVCCICLNEPKQLEVSSTCSHSFCAQCILRLYRNDHVQIKCPLCREGISLLFKLFQSSDATQQVQIKLREYNMTFDDNRPILRRIQQFPYVLKKLWKHFFRLQFLVFFLRRIQIIRFIFIILIYIILPFDLLPQKVLGVIGFLDDVLFILLVLSFIMTLAAIDYHRRHHNN